MVRGLKPCLQLALVMLVLTACSQTATKPDTPAVNLGEAYRLAAAAYEEQDWATSEKHYLTLTQRAPEESEPWFKLGNIYARTARLDGAVRCYREALVRDSRNVKAWHNMAVTQLRNSGESFRELEMLVDEDDPLHAKSVRIQQAINELVN